MSDTPETNVMPLKNDPHQEDKAGDILRKERITRRITVETIAKDLKLNITYIRALESNRYEDLPADPYVRVYLRSIANYLMLDPDEILKKFFKERGIEPHEDGQSNKIKISMNEQEKPSIPWLIIALVIVGLAILSYISNKMGLLPSSEPAKINSPADTTAPDIFPDTAGEIPSDSALEPQEEETIESNSEISPPLGTGDSLNLSITAIKDSVWVQVFADGNLWRNFIYAAQTRTFNALDSICVHVGNNTNLRYTKNGKPLKIKGKGVVVFKTDQSGVEIYKTVKWKSIFKEDA